MSKVNEERIPFLADEDQDHVRQESVVKRVNQRCYWLIVALISYAVASSSLLLYVCVSKLPTLSNEAPYTPARGQIQFETIHANPHWDMLYTSPPSPQVDEAWDSLVSPIYFSASEAEVRLSNEDPDDTVRVIEDGGYLGTIGVYHGIHCLRRIYWQLHEETYFPNRTQERREREIGHAAHCLGVILRDLMCNPDTALYTFQYDPEDHPTPRLKSGAQRQCMKWEPFHQWAASRAPGYHPRVRVPENYLRELRQKKALDGDGSVDIPYERAYL